MNESSNQQDASSSPFVATSISVSLTANDLDASVAWYRDALGFSVDHVFEREGTPFAARLRAGSVALLVTRDNGAKGAERLKGEGFSLRLTTKQSVDAVADRVRHHGWELDSEPTDQWGARAFRLRDPDGFRLVISSEPDQETQRTR